MKPKRNNKVYELDNIIATGCEKECWTVKGRPDKVLLIERNLSVSLLRNGVAWNASQEQRVLNGIQKMNIPVVSSKVVKVKLPNGFIVKGLLQKRMHGHTFGHSSDIKDAFRARVDKNKRIKLAKSIVNITKKLVKNIVSYDDLQYLYDKNGKAYVSDPGRKYKLCKKEIRDRTAIEYEIIEDLESVYK